MEPIKVAEYEALARAAMDPTAWGYYRSGADDELTLSANQGAFRRLALRYRVLVDVSVRSLATTVLGHEVALPVLVAPTAAHKLAHPDGELATVRGAGRAGTIFVNSTLSTTPVERVVAAATGPVWFQLYVYRDRGATRALIERAEAAGCRALVLTVDAPLLGRREQDVRNGFRLPDGLAFENMLAEGLGTMPPDAAGSGLAAYFASILDPSVSWKDLAWLRSVTSLPVIIKGVVRGDDAARAVDSGVAAVVVSNHGGRQLDTSPATIDALPEVVAAVAGRAEVLLDGGVRRGTDIVKALALGARAVLIGRPALWGLAARGADGVAHVLQLLRDELDLALALCGCPDVRALTPDLVALPSRA